MKYKDLHQKPSAIYKRAGKELALYMGSAPMKGNRPGKRAYTSTAAVDKQRFQFAIAAALPCVYQIQILTVWQRVNARSVGSDCRNCVFSFDSASASAAAAAAGSCSTAGPPYLRLYCPSRGCLL